MTKITHIQGTFPSQINVHQEQTFINVLRIYYVVPDSHMYLPQNTQLNAIPQCQ